MNALLATVSHGWTTLTDKQKLIITMTTLGTPIDRVGRTGFWAGGRRFIFDQEGELVKVLDYCTDGRIANNASLAVNGG